jgi:hypothetical protein
MQPFAYRASCNAKSVRRNLSSLDTSGVGDTRTPIAQGSRSRFSPSWVFSMSLLRNLGK